MLVVISTACIGSFKSNYHTITTTTAPTIINIFTYRNTSLHVTTNETDSRQNESQYDEIDSISYQSVTWRHYTLDDNVSVHHSSASDDKTVHHSTAIDDKAVHHSTVSDDKTVHHSTASEDKAVHHSTASDDKQSIIQLPVTTKQLIILYITMKMYKTWRTNIIIIFR
jgi:hypothetical protein